MCAKDAESCRKEARRKMTITTFCCIVAMLQLISAILSCSLAMALVGLQKEEPVLQQILVV